MIRKFDERPVERLGKFDQYAVAMHVKTARQLDNIAGIPDSLGNSRRRPNSCPSPTCRSRKVARRLDGTGRGERRRPPTP